VTLSSESWLTSLIETDGIIRHLSEKGSIIKFCIIENAEDHRSLRQNLVNIHQLHRLNLVTVNSGLADVSMPENIVKQIAAGFDVGNLLDNFMRTVWRDSGYPNDELRSARALATDLSLDSGEILMSARISVRRQLGELAESAHIPAFSRDFRNGLKALCTVTIEEGAASPTRAQLVTGFNMWLSGTAPAHLLRVLQIQWKLKRTNATQILRSILALSPLAGVNGSILHLDFRSVTNPALEPNASVVNYTKNKRTATYQWLREIIDQTYLFDSTLILVEAGPAFLDQSTTGPGIGRYDALKFRIMDDVLLGADNPSAVVTRIAG